MSCGGGRGQVCKTLLRTTDRFREIPSTQFCSACFTQGDLGAGLWRLNHFTETLYYLAVSLIKMFLCPHSHFTLPPSKTCITLEPTIPDALIPALPPTPIPTPPYPVLGSSKLLILNVEESCLGLKAHSVALAVSFPLVASWAP